jgi:deazaflavin-dependent oxidoreductase (nitroreductase family)
MTMPDDMQAYNRQLIEKFRADGGASMGDRPLLLLTTVGARSGEARTCPMMFVKDGDRLLVIASNNGATRHPGWWYNLVADPRVTVEVSGESYPATAAPLVGAERDQRWARIVQEYPFFAEHQQRAGERQIPVVAVRRND